MRARGGRGWSGGALRYGLPFLVLIVGGAAGLSAFVASKVEAVDARVQRRSERAAKLSEEHRKALSALNIDDYENIRVPPPPPEAEVEAALEARGLR